MRALLASAVLLAARSNTPASNPPAPDAGAPADVATDVVPAVDQPAAVCVAERTKACPCGDGRTGAQTCGPDGTFGACACFAMDAGGATDVPATGDASP